MCVTAFKDSKSRPAIMRGLEEVVGELSAGGVKADLWVDGSFLTQKIDPEDVDLVLRLPGDFYDNGTKEQKLLIEWFVSGMLKSSHKCDAYVWFEYSEGHPLHEKGEARRAYWLKQYGYSRGMEQKGIAVLQLTSGGS
jgi:hypothetical protein